MYRQTFYPKTVNLKKNPKSHPLSLCVRELMQYLIYCICMTENDHHKQHYYNLLYLWFLCYQERKKSK